MAHPSGARARRAARQHTEVEESGDETWIVSYADMVTLLFGFFVILYSFSSLDESKFSQMSEQFASAFKAPENQQAQKSDAGMTSESQQIRALQLLIAMLELPGSVEDNVARIERAAATSTDITAAREKIAELTVATPKLAMLQTPAADTDAGVVDLILPASTLFASGSATLSSEAQKSIAELAEKLALQPGIRSIEVIGHTDSTPPSSGSNFALSSERAGAVAEVLRSHGIESRRLSVRGMADLEPLAVEKTADGRIDPEAQAKNRRVHILIRRAVP